MSQTLLIEAATRLQDLYFQEYASREQFFTMTDFRFQIATTYSSMLNEIFQQMRVEGKKETGFPNIEIPGAWMITDKVKIEEEQGKLFAKLTGSVFTFDFDNTAHAFQQLTSVGMPHVEYRKISISESMFGNVLPKISKVLYFIKDAQTIGFMNGCVKAGAEVEAQYIPHVVGKEDNCKLSSNIVPAVIQKALALMLGARNGVVIDEANDSNKNATMNEQTNPMLKKLQQQ